MGIACRRRSGDPEPDRSLIGWASAGELAGRAARAIAGAVRSIRTAFERVELINDAVTAVVALEAGATVVTQDGDFDLLLQLVPGLDVLFYD